MKIDKDGKARYNFPGKDSWWKFCEKCKTYYISSEDKLKCPECDAELKVNPSYLSEEEQ